jgi:SCY1-like protein 2
MTSFQMATLSVQEAMGFKVDREAVATLVLPQLWAMSMGPCRNHVALYQRRLMMLIVLNVGQFQRFMAVIKKLADRVEKEHDQFLRDSQRIEDRSGIASNGMNEAATSQGIDFESLVGRSNAPPTMNGPTTISTDTTGDENSWDDDGWGSMFSGTASTFQAYRFAKANTWIDRFPHQHHQHHPPHPPRHFPHLLQFQLGIYHSNQDLRSSRRQL